MPSKSAVVASWLAISIVACGGLVAEPSTFDDDGRGGQRGDGGDVPTSAPEAGGARDGGIVPGEAGREASTPCGDGILVAGEACDDGNNTSADGCSASCAIEPGWSCTGAPSSCVTICGDGIVAGGETCDDEAACPGSCRGTLWSKGYGGTDYQETAGLAVDAAGAAVITGNFRGTMSFGGGSLVSTGANTVFITKIDGTGKHLWSRRAGGAGDDRAMAVAMDAAGNVIVTGVFSDTIDFGGGPLVSAGSWDVFVAKLDGAGNHLWSKRFGNQDQQEAHTVAVDATGNVVFGGMFWGAVDFGGGALTSAGDTDLFVAKLDAAGNHVWSKRFGNTARQNARGVAVDASGGVLVTGGISGPLDLGGGLLAAIGEGDAFLLSLDASGAHRWSKRWGRANVYVSGNSTTVDGDGNVIVAGYTEGDTDLGTGPLPYRGGGDVTLGKFSAAGVPIFARSFGSAGSEAPSAVATDGAGNILLVGSTNGAIDFGNGPIPHAGWGAFVARLAPSGALLYAAADGATASADGIGADALGNVFVAGTFRNSLNLGGIPLTSPGVGDEVFLTKIAP